MQRDYGFCCWWFVFEGAVWPSRVVVFAPFFDDYLCLLEGVQYLAVEQLIPEAGVEALAAAIFPRDPGTL